MSTMDGLATGWESQDLRRELEQAVEGLSYPSDADYPFQVAVHPASQHGPFDAPRFLEFLGRPADVPVEMQEAEAFFDELAFSPALQRLYRFLRERLTFLQVFRLGRVHVEVYIVGQDSHGALAVLSTRSLET
jgi:hypothetical protein